MYIGIQIKWKSTNTQLMPARPKRFKRHLDKYGVAIIPDVLNPEECESMVSGIWDYFEHITQPWEKPIGRDDKTSWRGIYDLFPMHSMLLQHFSIGQSQVVWDIRQSEKVMAPFEKLWGLSKRGFTGLIRWDSASRCHQKKQTEVGTEIILGIILTRVLLGMNLNCPQGWGYRTRCRTRRCYSGILRR